MAVGSAVRDKGQTAAGPAGIQAAAGPVLGIGGLAPAAVVDGGREADAGSAVGGDKGGAAAAVEDGRRAADAGSAVGGDKSVAAAGHSEIDLMHFNPLFTSANLILNHKCIFRHIFFSSHQSNVVGTVLSKGSNVKCLR
jgi:hypothetical protein